MTAAMKIPYKVSHDVPSPGIRFPATQYFVHFKRNIATANHTTVEATLTKSVARLYVRGWFVDVVLTLFPQLIQGGLQQFLNSNNKSESDKRKSSPKSRHE